MFPKLNIILKHNTSYSNTGNFFSKSLIIKENLEKHKKIALIVDSEKSANQYKKTFKYLRINFEEVHTYSSLINLSKNSHWLFLVYNYSLKDEIITASQLEYFSQEIKKSKEYDTNILIKKLSEMWYEYSDYSNFGSYKKSWDILSIISFNWEFEYKVSFWWESVEEILEIKKIKEDIVSSREIESVFIWWKQQLSMQNIPPFKGGLRGRGWIHPDKKYSTLQTYIKSSKIFTILDSLDFSEFYEENTRILDNFCSFDFIINKQLQSKNLEINSPKVDNIDTLKNILSESENPPIVYTKNINTIANFIEYNSLPQIEIHEISGNFLKSFTFKSAWVIILSDDILWKIFIKKRLNKSLAADLDLLLKITPWDFVVHIDHGIWIFKGIIKKTLPQSPHLTSPHGRGIIQREFIEVAYKWEDKLFVPITEVSRVNKFVWWDNPKLTGLNTTEWTRKLKKVDHEIQIIAEELLEIYSKRKMWKSFAFLADKEKEWNFQASFPYTYTPDQDEVIWEILDDMEKLQPMDRLLVWDVGFGKTEVAFNAIYRAFINKKQSVFIAPLVVLAYEHFEKALERYRGLWMKIAVVTRMESQSKVNTVLAGLKSGEIDLVIWTHKLLSDKIIYKNLWLLIVDEEHKFGVSDKEKIKKLKSTIDILSMSATPIPRSLNMALSQIKQISIIKTPPQGRQDINTIISKFSERVILDWCEAEFSRWGQVYFVHNRVQTLVHFEKILQWLFPDKKIIITHGQLPWDRLEQRIIDFKHKKYDILLTTTVIENGIDFPNVNTIFIHEAQNFGISQIHQLRWRVWRSDRLGHCYLLYKKENLWVETAKRLKTIVNYSYLGAGFELAMKDLEIRWGGDLLGCRQSGQTSEIGVNLYLKMVEQKIAELKEQSPLSVSPQGREETQKNILKINTKIDLQLNIWVPDSYFDSDLDKINFYREIESVSQLEDLEELISDFRQENNVKIFPEEMDTFFTLLKVKLNAQKLNISHIKKVWINYQLDFSPHSVSPTGREVTQQLKKFLDLDKEIKFVVITDKRLRTPVKHFTNPEKFLKYLLTLFERKITRRKVKLKNNF